MKTETLGNIAGPVLHRAGAAGREQLPALIGRSLTGETSLKQDSYKGRARELQGSSKGDPRVVRGASPQIACPAGLLAKGGS